MVQEPPYILHPDAPIGNILPRPYHFITSHSIILSVHVYLYI